MKILFAFTCILLIYSCKFQQDTLPAATTPSRNPFAVVDSIIQQQGRKNNVPGLAYGVVVDGKLVHARYSGFANIAGNVRVDSLTAFRIASMTKSFTTMAILILRDQGKLSLDDPASRYIPQMKETRLLTKDAPAITIRDLMTHRAGFPEDNPYGDRQMADTDEELEALMSKGPSFSNVPGISYEYSNLGISLLGLIIRNISGMPYQQFIAENIFKPLGMTHTYWEYTKVPANQLAHGYRWLNNQWNEEALLHDGSWGAMGGLITTIGDFTKYIQLHLSAWPPRDDVDTGPAKRSSLREMHQLWNVDRINTLFKFGSGRPCPIVTGYGYGLGVTKDCNNRLIIGHGGGLPGFGSHWRIMPDHNIGVVVFSNNTYAGFGGTTLTVLDTLIALTGREPRSMAPSAILEQRKNELVALLPEWKNAPSSPIFAENFFPDNPVDSLKKKFGELYARIGTVKEVTAMKPLNSLRGEFNIIGEKGKLRVFFTLTPETSPTIQFVEAEAVE